MIWMWVLQKYEKINHLKYLNNLWGKYPLLAAIPQKAFLGVCFTANRVCSA